MSAEDRSAGLAAAARVARPALLELAETIASSAAIHVLAPPEPASVMLELECAVGAFALTEVIVTTARVRCDDALGWGCVLGLDREGALASALLDAKASAAVDELAAQALALEARTRRDISRRIAATKV